MLYTHLGYQRMACCLPVCRSYSLSVYVYYMITGDKDMECSCTRALTPNVVWDSNYFKCTFLLLKKKFHVAGWLQYLGYSTNLCFTLQGGHWKFWPLDPSYHSSTLKSSFFFCLCLSYYLATWRLCLIPVVTNLHLKCLCITSRLNIGSCVLNILKHCYIYLQNSPCVV